MKILYNSHNKTIKYIEFHYQNRQLTYWKALDNINKEILIQDVEESEIIESYLKELLMKKPLKIKLSKVNKYEFEGYVEDQDLTSEQLKTLKHVVDPKHVEELAVYGSFSVNQEDYETFYVHIDDVSVFSADEKKHFDLKEEQFNYDELCQEIENSGHDIDWQADAMARQADDMYDFLMDR